MAAAASEQVCPRRDAGRGRRRGRPCWGEEEEEKEEEEGGKEGRKDEAGGRRALRTPAPPAGRCLWGGAPCSRRLLRPGLPAEPSGAESLTGKNKD